jgi:hypothetical protein
LPSSPAPDWDTLMVQANYMQALSQIP